MGYFCPSLAESGAVWAPHHALYKAEAREGKVAVLGALGS